MRLEFVYTDALVRALLEIERYKTALDYLPLPTRERQRLMYEAKLKKTHFSTSIEGNVLSYNQVEKVVSKKTDENRLGAEQEVMNYWDALTYLEEEAKKKTPITLSFILSLHDIIIKKGALKKIPFRSPTPAGMLFAVYDSSTREAEYIPPEAKDVEPLLKELISWFGSHEALPAPVLSAIISYAFVSIHPFDDGNGRTARALATYVLMLYSYDLKGLNSFEEYYMSDLDGYYSSLQMGLPALFYDGRENPPHLEIWIEYFCRIMALNAEKIYEQASELCKTSASPLIEGLNKKDLTLLRYCLEKQKSSIKAKELSELFAVSPRAISKWAEEWMKKGLLSPSSGDKRITSYCLGEKYRSLKLEELGFIE